MNIFMKVNESGFPVAFYDERLLGQRKLPVYADAPAATEDNPYPVPELIGYEDNPDCKIPADAIEITPEQYAEFIENSGQRKWVNGAIVEYVPEPADAIIILPAVKLWERMTEAEASQVEAIMQTQSFRVRQIFMTAQTYRSDHELWPLLQQVALDLFGDERASELLTPPLI